MLTLAAEERSADQLHVALVALQQAVEAFSDYPVSMQRSLVKRGFYEQ